MYFNFFLCFIAAKSFDDLLSLAVYCRDRVNSYMFVYALSVVMLHRPETRNLRLPSHVEMFPSLYMGPSVFSRAREEAEVVPVDSRVRIGRTVVKIGRGGDGDAVWN